MIHHRTTICSAKLIFCLFCHFQVFQQKSNDSNFQNPEIIFFDFTFHELTNGARTIECHLCVKIERFRDMSFHFKLHDFERQSRPKPRICRNVNCDRTIDGVNKNGQTKNQFARNELNLCDICFDFFYVSMYDFDGKTLKRRVKRKYFIQLFTGCGQS